MTEPTGDWRAARAQDGRTLESLSHERPQLVVFLRHGGCPFCLEALADLARQRESIEEAGTGIVLVHMMTDGQAAQLFREFQLEDLPRISDPERSLYAAFGLKRGGLAQVSGPRVWWRGLKSTLAGRLPRRPRGDILQLPGAFLMAEGRVVREFAAETSADRPDYAALACPAQPVKPTSAPA